MYQEISHLYLLPQSLTLSTSEYIIHSSVFYLCQYLAVLFFTLFFYFLKKTKKVIYSVMELQLTLHLKCTEEKMKELSKELTKTFSISIALKAID